MKTEHLTIEELTAELEADERNRSYTERHIPPVYQVSENARVLIVGQAPGKKVEETLIPFNDKSGEKLISWMGIDRETFYSDRIAIVPMDFYYPGKGKTGDLPPRKFIAEEYHERILSLMPNLKLTILIGNYAMKYYLKERMEANLTETVKNYANYMPQYFPIVHPSPLNFRWQKKNPWFEAEVVPELQKAVAAALCEKF
ncbi:MAG: uracil-DNA glycosylase family protein [Eubacterium sp.]|nr:uracil-DNA glycosylase family protein [Eubacterium sp.]